MDVSVHRATQPDLPGLRILRSQAIEAACSDVYERQRFADLVVGNDDRLPAFLEDRATTVWIAETPVTPVSYVVFEPEAGDIHGIFTSPDYQREGFATLLLERVEQRLLDADCPTVQATVPTVAQSFFRANGFDERSEGEWRGLPAVVMGKSLRE